MTLRGRRAATTATATAMAMALAVAIFQAQPAAAETPVTVFAAASLKNALDDVLGTWAKGGGGVARAVYASSSTLARQIDKGAPADLYVSANRRWVAWLARRGRLEQGTQVVLLGNRLVMVAPAGQARPVTLAVGPILARLGDRRLALGDPTHVPAGLYAAAALKKLGLWQGLAPRLAPAANVRAALALVARGEAPLGIVYRTDALEEEKVATVATFPVDSQPEILYEAAIPAGKADGRSRRLLAYLRGAAAGAVFRRHGFCAPPPCSD